MDEDQKQQLINNQKDMLAQDALSVKHNQLVGYLKTYEHTQSQGAIIYRQFQDKRIAVNQYLKTTDKIMKLSDPGLEDSKGVSCISTNQGQYSLKDRNDDSFFAFEYSLTGMTDLKSDLKNLIEITVSQRAGKVQIFISETHGKPNKGKCDAQIDGSNNHNMDITFQFEPKTRLVEDR